MREKRGQFFILAAVILISLLAGIFIYRNQVFVQDPRSGVESLKGEIDSETGVVIDYGLYRGEDKLENFIGGMSENLLNRNSPDMVFFYGNSSTLKILNLCNETLNYNISGIEGNCSGIKENIIGSVNFGGSSLGVSLNLAELERDNLVCNISSANLGDSVKFNINGTDYEIPLDSGKNFYFMIKREMGGEVYVAVK